MDRFLTVGALVHIVAGGEVELQSSSKRRAWNNRPSPGGRLLMRKFFSDGRPRSNSRGIF